MTHGIVLYQTMSGDTVAYQSVKSRYPVTAEDLFSSRPANSEKTSGTP
jgi:hypothetical protein